MGEMADDLIDQEMGAFEAHLWGECDIPCPWCYEKMTSKEKKEFDTFCKSMGKH